MTDAAIVVWNGKEYFLQKLIAGANDGPVIEVDVSKVSSDAELPVLKDGKPLQVNEIIVLEHCGEYVVFGDMTRLPESGTFQARLLTKPRLKRACDVKLSDEDRKRYHERMSEKPFRRNKHRNH